MERDGRRRVARKARTPKRWPPSDAGQLVEELHDFLYVYGDVEHMNCAGLEEHWRDLHVNGRVPERQRMLCLLFRARELGDDQQAALVRSMLLKEPNLLALASAEVRRQRPERAGLRAFVEEIERCSSSSDAVEVGARPRSTLYYAVRGLDRTPLAGKHVHDFLMTAALALGLAQAPLGRPEAGGEGLQCARLFDAVAERPAAARLVANVEELMERTGPVWAPYHLEHALRTLGFL